MPPGETPIRPVDKPDLARLRIGAEKRPRARVPAVPVAVAIVLIAIPIWLGRGLWWPPIEGLWVPTVEIGQVEAVAAGVAPPSALTANGYVVAQRKSDLASKVTGRLIWLGVEEGSFVKKDQVVARLESQDVAASKDQAAANVNVARYTLEQAKAELQNATLFFNRNKELASRGVVAKSVYDDAFARYQKAIAGVAAAEETLTIDPP